MNKVTPFIKLLVLMFTLSCDSKGNFYSEPSKRLNFKEMFSLSRSEQWEYSIRQSVKYQLDSCNFSSIYVHTELEDYLKHYLENLPHKLPELNKWVSPRRDLLAYLSGTKPITIPDSIPYTDIYLKYSRDSGERVNYYMTLTIIDKDKSTHFDFIYVNLLEGGRSWRVGKIWSTDDSKMNDLYTQFSCPSKDCETTINENELIISKFTKNQIESKVIVQDCLHKLVQLNQIYRN